MKRSEINEIIRKADAFLASKQFILPEWANWSVEDWKKRKNDVSYITERMLGWDITDFGSGDFKSRGLFLFTLRNGKYGVDKKPYAEKIMIVEENQETPMHFHWNKMEDIINRGGGILVMKLYCADENDQLDMEKPVEIVSDGVKLTVPAGTVLELKKGQSVTYTQRLYHEFWAKEGCGPVLIGEVSMCNDDDTDNHFLTAPGRFPAIDEDEKPYRLLCNEYPQR